MIDGVQFLKRGEMMQPNTKRASKTASAISISLVVLALVILGLAIKGPVLKVVQLLQPNTRMYIKGCVSATAELRGSADAKYIRIVIGKNGREYAGEPAFELKFNDGSVLKFPDIDLIELSTLTTKTGKATDFSVDYPLAKEYYFKGCGITIAQGRVVQMRLYGIDDSADKIQIRTGSAKQWHSMPCSDEDLVDLFGRPDHLFDDWRH